MKSVKYSIVASGYNNSKGLSTVIIKTKLGEYTGAAKLHPEDKDYESRFTGCEIAEARAYVKYLKDEIAIAKIEYETLLNLEKNFTKSTQPELKYDKGFYKAVNRISKNTQSACYDLYKLKKRKAAVEKAIENLPEAKAKMHDSIMERANKKNK